MTLPYFTSNKPRPVFSYENEGFCILPPNKPNQKILLTTSTFFFCKKVCQVCVTLITHQSMFFIITIKLILPALALLIAVAVILFARLSSFTRQCIYCNDALVHVQKTKLYVCTNSNYWCMTLCNWLFF